MKASARGLYFTAGIIPTAKEREEAQALGITSFRNSALVGSSLEPAALVAGKVPEGYRRVQGQKIAASPK